MSPSGLPPNMSALVSGCHDHKAHATPVLSVSAATFPERTVSPTAGAEWGGPDNCRCDDDVPAYRMALMTSPVLSVEQKASLSAAAAGVFPGTATVLHDGHVLCGDRRDCNERTRPIILWLTRTPVGSSQSAGTGGAAGAAAAAAAGGPLSPGILQIVEKSRITPANIDEWTATDEEKRACAAHWPANVCAACRRMVHPHRQRRARCHQ
jgi:hypothetical protein